MPNLSSKITDPSGRIAIVTGANIGLGFETTKGLAAQGIKVVMACRDITKAVSAKSAVLWDMPNADVEIMVLDLSSLDSVRKFANEYQEQYGRLDLLINNAGIMVPPFSLTEDGFESQMGVNYFGHFALTALLLPLLEKTQGARIVSLSSIAHRSAKIDFNNLNSEKNYSKMIAYGQSKLACLIFSYELNRRLCAAGSTVLSVAAHPGVSETNLGQHVPPILYRFISLILPLFSHKPPQAAQPTLYAALGEDVKGGDFYGPTGLNEMKGKTGKVSSNRISKDPKVAQRLWEMSEKLTNTKFNC